MYFAGAALNGLNGDYFASKQEREIHFCLGHGRVQNSDKDLTFLSFPYVLMFHNYQLNPAFVSFPRSKIISTIDSAL
jgi:hypothetical protein